MAFEFQGRKLPLVGVVGSGQIGPDIALFFAKTLCLEGTRVVVVDIAEAALEKGRARLQKKVDRGVESGAFTSEWGAKMKESVTFTTDYEALRGAALVVEAATEDAGIKTKIFRQLEAICPKGAILCSNSSHLEPEVIAEPLADRARSAVIHYFFPAERNLLVEVVPGRETAPAVADWLMAFYERIGKVPIRVKSRYGYAIDPIFEGVFLAAALCVEKGLGSTKEVDAAAARALGLTVGPFTAMNLTGGNAITAPGLAKEGEKIMPWFRTPEIQKRALAAGTPWEVPARGEKVALPEDREKRIAEEMQGAYLGLCDEILSAGLVPLGDLEMGIELALDMTPPAAMANRLGVPRALALASAYAAENPGFAAPRWLAEAGLRGGPIAVPVVPRRDLDGVAVLTIRRPKVLNALNEAAFDQLHRHLAAIRTDPGIQAVVVTGFGVKAFVSGADVHFLSRIDGPETGMDGSRNAQRLTLAFEELGKPVVAALNGVAFGGGLEIAMACTARIAREDLDVLGAQPEVNLGIIPGAGGTQRLPRLVGIERAAALLRTGQPFSAKRALEMGLVHELVHQDALLERAVALARDLARGKATVPAMPTGPLPDVPPALPTAEIGHRSQVIDRILCRAILDGARKSLREGLEIENRAFGEVCRTEDMKIGIRTFLEQGPRAKAPFVHR